MTPSLGAAAAPPDGAAHSWCLPVVDGASALYGASATSDISAPSRAVGAWPAASVEAPSTPPAGAAALASAALAADALAAAFVAAQDARAGSASFPVVHFALPTVRAAGHAAGVGASFTPPLAATPPPPPADTSAVVRAPLLAACVGASSALPVTTAAPAPPTGTPTAFL
jgi:hypothetical protein